MAAGLSSLPGLFAGTAPTLEGKTPVPTPPITPVSWLDDTNSPVTNPIWFEDPVIRSEVRPIYMHHRIHDPDWPTRRS